jgi:hypothetical protein
MRYWIWRRIRDLLEMKEERVQNRVIDRVEVALHIYCSSFRQSAISVPPSFVQH